MRPVHELADTVVIQAKLPRQQVARCAAIITVAEMRIQEARMPFQARFIQLRQYVIERGAGERKIGDRSDCGCDGRTCPFVQP